MSLFQRIYLAIERVVMTYLVPRDRPGPIWRVIFKQPIWIYKLGLGGFIGKRVLLLHTTGRKTGKHRITPLEYSYAPVAGTYTVMAGWQDRLVPQRMRQSPRVRPGGTACVRRGRVPGFS